jgi:phosphate transport system protein
MNEHTVKSFGEELKTLESKIAQMGGLCEYLLADAIEALSRGDLELAERAILEDKAIDALEHEIEEMAILTIARRQPVAVDLRQVMAALRISSDLERIGDLAKNIAKRTLAISREQHPKQLISGVKHIGRLALGQLKDVLDAYSHRDAAGALKVWNRDEQIDALYNSLFRELLTYMMEDARNIGLCTHLLFGAKNIERIGDHTTNIAETIHYLVTGKSITRERPKGDLTSVMAVEYSAPGDQDNAEK